MRNKRIFFIILIFFICGSLFAQEFGFGAVDDAEETSGDSSDAAAATGGSGRSGVNFSVGGEIGSTVPFFINDFSKGSDFVDLDNLVSVGLDFSLEASFFQGVVNLVLQSTAEQSIIDEAYFRTYFGYFEISAGLRKLTWGKADNMGPMDVINPLDTSAIYTELADSNSLMGVKIARPMVHISFRFGQFSKIEGVFIPVFKPHYIDSEGRWAPSEMNKFKNPEIPMDDFNIAANINANIIEPETNKILYAQAGLRYTTTFGGVDFGAQYYYGRMTQPAAKIRLAKLKLNDFNPVLMSGSIDADMDIEYVYNPYHQIGIDYAQVVLGFNIRAELAANITEDIKGDDPSIYNPSIAWSVGFDRDLFWGINLNLQVNESIRLMHSKLGTQEIILPDDIMTDLELLTELVVDHKTDKLERILNNSLSKIDIEGGKKITSTRITAALSKKFLRDALEVRVGVVWGIEDMDGLILPAIIWSREGLTAALSSGIFVGNEKGQLGQYKNNNFLKTSVKYSF